MKKSDDMYRARGERCHAETKLVFILPQLAEKKLNRTGSRPLNTPIDK